MISFNKIITDYIKVDDTIIKNTIINLYVNSKSESLPHFLHYLLELCGLHTINVMLVDGKNWDAYISFSHENIFSKKKGVHEISKMQNCKIQAEENLAHNIIHLLDNIDYNTFINRVNPSFS